MLTVPGLSVPQPEVGVKPQQGMKYRVPIVSWGCRSCQLRQSASFAEDLMPTMVPGLTGAEGSTFRSYRDLQGTLIIFAAGRAKSSHTGVPDDQGRQCRFGVKITYGQSGIAQVAKSASH